MLDVFFKLNFFQTSSPKTGSSITIQRKLTNLWKYQDQSKNLFGTPMKPPGICLKLRLSFVSYVVASYTEHSRILKLNFPTKQNITKWKMLPPPKYASHWTFWLRPTCDSCEAAVCTQRRPPPLNLQDDSKLCWCGSCWSRNHYFVFLSQDWERQSIANMFETLNMSSINTKIRWKGFW